MFWVWFQSDNHVTNMAKPRMLMCMSKRRLLQLHVGVERGAQDLIYAIKRWGQGAVVDGGGAGRGDYGGLAVRGGIAGAGGVGLFGTGGDRFGKGKVAEGGFFGDL